MRFPCSPGDPFHLRNRRSNTDALRRLAICARLEGWKPSQIGVWLCRSPATITSWLRDTGRMRRGKFWLRGNAARSLGLTAERLLRCGASECGDSWRVV